MTHAAWICTFLNFMQIISCSALMLLLFLLSLVRSVCADAWISSPLTFTGIISLSLFTWWIIRLFGDLFFQSQKWLPWTHLVYLFVHRCELCLYTYKWHFWDMESSASMRHCKTAHQYQFTLASRGEFPLLHILSRLWFYMAFECVVGSSSGFICIS